MTDEHAPTVDCLVTLGLGEEAGPAISGIPAVGPLGTGVRYRRQVGGVADGPGGKKMGGKERKIPAIAIATEECKPQ